jgi:hypothetical protein
MLLVNRYREFDISVLQDTLQDAWQKGGLAAVRAYLATQADASLDFRFRTEGDDYACR